MEYGPVTAALPVIPVADAAEDIFAVTEEEATFVLLPRLGIGLGEIDTIFSDGSYVANWIPRRRA